MRTSAIGRAVPVAAIVLLAALGGCRALTESERHRACRQMDALGGDTAQMVVGAARTFEAAGFQPAGYGESCVGTIRDGFRYTTDAPAIASVEATTGVVTAHAVGTTTLRARRDVDGLAYRGTLRIIVVPDAARR